MNKELRKTFDINRTKIRVELAKRNKKKTWLARELGITRQGMHYIFESGSLKRLSDIARILEVDEHELISAREDIF